MSTWVVNRDNKAAAYIRHCLFQTEKHCKLLRPSRASQHTPSTCQTLPSEHKTLNTRCVCDHLLCRFPSLLQQHAAPPSLALTQSDEGAPKPHMAHDLSYIIRPVTGAKMRVGPCTKYTYHLPAAQRNSSYQNSTDATAYNGYPRPGRYPGYAHQLLGWCGKDALVDGDGCPGCPLDTQLTELGMCHSIVTEKGGLVLSILLSIRPARQSRAAAGASTKALSAANTG